LRRRRGSLATAGLVAIGGLGLIAFALAGGFAAGSSHALYSPGTPWGVTKSRDAVGQLWSAGSIPLCTRDNATVRLISITPAAIYGQIRLNRIAVRKVHWFNPGTRAHPNRDNPARNVIGTYPGIPPGSHSPSGFLVQSSCQWRRRADPVYETVVVASRTGSHGGWIKGLRVTYRNGTAHGSYLIPFTFGLCGQGPAGTVCLRDS